MYQLIRCKCGEEEMETDGRCKKCGLDRLKGTGRELVLHFMERLKGLRVDERSDAMRIMIQWAKDGKQPT